MYSLVMATLLTAGAETPDFHRARPVAVYSSCYGCCGGYAVPVHSCFRPPVVYSSCFGCCGGVVYSSCHGCCGGVVYSSCFGCCGGVVVSERVVDYKGAKGAVEYKSQSPKAQGAKSQSAEPKAQNPGKGQSPKTQGAKGQGASADAPARVLVKAPVDVKIYVNGQLTRRQSEEQSFNTPELTAGETFHYEIVARREGEDDSVVIERKVTVTAGRESVLDLTKEFSSVSTASR